MRTHLLPATLFLFALLAAGCQPAAESAPDANLSTAAQGGREIFNRHAQPACSICHTLQHAGAAGTLGANLDELKPDYERVKKAVIEGAPGMMPVGGLTPEQIETVSRYVAEVAGGGDG